MRRMIWLVVVLVPAFVAVASPARAQNPNPNCTELTFEEAQEILAQDESDPRGLDLDYDGVACEASPRSGTGGGGGVVNLPRTGTGAAVPRGSAAAVALVGALGLASACVAFAARRPRRA